MRGGQCLILQGRLHLPPFPFLLLFAVLCPTNSVQREAKRLPRRWQRTRPSHTSSAFVPPHALAVFESAILFSSLGCEVDTLFKCYKNAYTSTLSLSSSSFSSLYENNLGPEGGKALAAALAKNTTITTIQCVHPSASTCRL